MLVWCDPWYSWTRGCQKTVTLWCWEVHYFLNSRSATFAPYGGENNVKTSSGYLSSARKWTKWPLTWRKICFCGRQPKTVRWKLFEKFRNVSDPSYNAVFVSLEILLACLCWATAHVGPCVAAGNARWSRGMRTSGEWTAPWRLRWCPWSRCWCSRRMWWPATIWRPRKCLWWWACSIRYALWSRSFSRTGSGTWRKASFLKRESRWTA